MSIAATSYVDDGYIQGHLHPYPVKCGRCLRQTRCISVEGTSLPRGITPQATILWEIIPGRVLSKIGIGCGCYAKFHRQVVHIRGA